LARTGLANDDSVSYGPPGDAMKPDFLGIGAPRAATSWLHRQLAAHPALWLPPVKELHWFDLQRPASRPFHPIPDQDPGEQARRFRREHLALLWRSHRRALARRRLDGAELAWSARYLLGRRTDAWYGSLFPSDRVAGEITPAYMMLEPPIVEAIRARCPELRVLLMLRDPIDRIWSGTRQFLLVDGDLDESARRRALQRFDTTGVRLRTDYRRALHVWRGILGSDRVFVGFYDEVAERPRDLLDRVLRFLGVDPAEPGYRPEPERRVNVARELEIPRDLERELAVRYLESLRSLAREFGEYPARWLARAERAAGTNGG
jgi:hypothetical protein